MSENINKLIENSNKWRSQRQQEMGQAEKNQADELAKLKDSLNTLADEAKKSRETIEKNLSSIMSHKHSIHKTQDSINETGLPISNTYHDEFLNFISDTTAFISEIGENEKNNSENIDESELSTSVKTCNENIMKQIHQDNNVMDGMQTIMENMNAVVDYRSVLIKDELPPSESSFLNGL